MELNSVKLYIKRGDKPFTEGIVGHFKLLKDRTTLDERLCKPSFIFPDRLLSAQKPTSISSRTAVENIHKCPRQ